MANPSQHRNWILGTGRRAATAALALAIAFMLIVVATQPAQAQTFNVLHNFSGGQDGGNPYAGVTLDKAGNLYGTVPSAPAPTFTTFDAPGAGTGTGAISINTTGDIAGIYVIGGNVAHGFVRAANGTITEFDAPGAGMGNKQGTFPFSINTADAIAGYYSDASNVYHGFVRAANGTITEFDAPGAGMGGHAGTIPISINTAGAIAGHYRDASDVYHGFVRAANGAIATFDVPGAGTGAGLGTVGLSINTADAIAGYYSDASDVYHGFVRAANGTITTFDAPGAGTGAGLGTVAVSINTAGAIAGVYADASFVGHGFVRAADGTITDFDAPGAGMLGWLSSLSVKGKGPPTQGTFGFSINDAGAIAGLYLDASVVLHGFVRAANGTITTFDAPGAGTATMQGTGGVGINAAGNITGSYLDASAVGHGFVLTPATMGYGAAYRLQHKGSNWTFTPLYSFAGGSDGANPEARVIFGPNGTLYGTTLYGGGSGGGTVFNLRPKPTACLTGPNSCPWGETVLYSFLNGTDGAYPAYGDLLFDQAGNIYGSTAGGGNPGLGTVYELTPSGSGWTESVLHNFSGSDGATPFSGVLFDNAGDLYGTTTGGGLGNSGTVFELTYSVGSGWTERLLNSFRNGSDGSYPTAGLIFDQSGNLYGATSNGGSAGGGTVFKLTPSGGSWTYSLVYSFTGGANCGPWGNLVMDGAGNLYGTTVCDGANNAGSVFKLTHGSWTYTSLHDFTGGSDGKNPYCNVVFDANGNLYGTG